MLSEQLKAGTKLNHQLLEKKMVAAIRAISSIKDYEQLLIVFYSFFGGLEAAINIHIDRTQLPDYAQRRKTAALADDLAKLGGLLPQLAPPNDLPAILNHLQALGALYVIEGSTLGGSIISKMVSRQLNMHDNAGLSFFNGYGNDTEEMWQIFKQTLDTSVKPPDEETVIQAANETFLKFGNWFDKLS